MPDLVLLRHGESVWNAENLFTGWHDVDLSPKGETEAEASGRLLAAEGDLDLMVVHTSVLTRAIRTAELALAAAGRSWLPVRRHWRLNERHYGDLQGRNKVETPPLPDGDERSAAKDPRYRDVPAEALPATECLADVVRRAVPYWQDAIVPDLLSTGGRGGAVIVVAHGNSIRALRKHLEHIGDDAIVDLEIPTGIPFRYRLADNLTIESAEYLGDPGAAAAAAEAVRRQAG
jgi:2,3-bisphosphoglycerate-dependent phosphoglycerate mutase